MSKNQKKRKYGNQRNFYIKLHLKDCLEWNSQLSKASWRWHHLPYLIISLVCGSSIQSIKLTIL